MRSVGRKDYKRKLLILLFNAFDCKMERREEIEEVEIAAPTLVRQINSRLLLNQRRIYSMSLRGARHRYARQATIGGLNPMD